MLLFAVLLSLFVGLGAAYYGLIVPNLAPRGTRLPAQAVGLSLFALSLFGALFALALATTGSLEPWWRNGGPGTSLGLVVGMCAYAVTTAYGRAATVDIAAR